MKQPGSLTLLQTILMLSTDSWGTEINITQIDNCPGIYFKELGRAELYSNEWKIVVFYNLENLKNASMQINQYVQNLNSLCKILDKNPIMKVTCNSIISEINQITNDINEKFNLLTHETRSKRALFDVVGMISKTLFGTLNEEDAKYYDAQISKLEQNENHLLNLVRNQTIVVDTTINIFNKTRRQFEEQINALDIKYTLLRGLVDDITNQTNTLRITSEIESFTSLITLISIRYQNTVETVLDIVTDVRHGKPHPSIITPEQLENVLTTIRKRLPTNLKLPSSIRDTNLLSLYRISHTSASIINSKIIYELQIPLPFAENYQLYKILPLPVMHQSHLVFIQPSMEYLLIDYNKEHYYDMTYTELSNCVTEDHHFYLCRILHPIFTIESDTKLCELQLLKHQTTIPPTCQFKIFNRENAWIQLSQVNKWLFSVNGNLNADYICNDVISPQVITGVGILEISKDCYLRTPHLILRGDNTKFTQLKNFYIPPLNLTKFISYEMPSYVQNTTKTKIGVVKYSPQTELQELSQKINDLKKQEDKALNKVDPHTVHHYSAVYSIIVSLILYAAYKIYKNLTARKTTNRSDANSTQNANVENVPTISLSLRRQEENN